MKISHLKIKGLDFNYITDGIYIGNNKCCKGRFDEYLRKEEIEADISLEEIRLDEPFGVQFYVWIPIKNHTPPSQEQFDFGVSILEKLVAMKKRVYIHCKNGHGRASTLVSAYLIKQGKEVDEAIAFIKAKRPSIHLADSQKMALEIYSKRINKYFII